jgi:hypothetical protein
MLPVERVDAILAPHRLELTDGGVRVKSMDFEFGTVGVEAIYEMMFLHEIPREEALKDIAMLLNVSSPTKKYDPPLRGGKKKKVKVK